VRRRRRARFILALALSLTALWPVGASASEFRTFDLPSPLVDTSTAGGTLPSGRTVPKVNVLLPDGYKAHGKRRYPVLWLLHGANGGTDGWFGSQQIPAEAADMRAIVVMPDGGMVGMYTDWWNGGARGGPAWASYHLDVLRRAIERRYRVRPGRRWHAVGGISMGGQGALRYAAMLPGYFGSAVSFSAFLPDMQSDFAKFGLNLLPVTSGIQGANYDAIFGPRSGAYAEGNNPQALAPNYGHTRLYVTSGDGNNCPGDPPTSTTALDGPTEAAVNAGKGPFAAAARTAGADVTEVTTCGVHTFGVWDRAFLAARAWGFFRPVAERPRSWVYRTVATTGEAWGLRFRFAQPPSAVVEFRRSSRTLAASGSGSVRIRGGQGCRLSATLPFKRRMPLPCTAFVNHR
jgi:S-formylglutathione hydrolase FrmB